MEKCSKTECPLFKDSVRVPYDGDRQDVTIAFVGESPGYSETRMGAPFVGRSGELLRKQAAEAGLAHYNCFIANSAQCLIPKEKLSIKQINTILNNCREHLEQALREMKPRVIVTLGALAAQQILKVKSLGDVRGTFVWSDEFSCYVFPTYHPAFCLRKPSSLDLFSADFFRLKTFLNNNMIVTRGDEITVEVRESIKDVLDSAKLVALDTETQGLDYVNPTNILISYSVAVSSSHAYQIFFHEASPVVTESTFIIPWEVKEGKTRITQNIAVSRSSNFALKLNELKTLLEDASIKKVFMNTKYDLHHISALFRNAGYPSPVITGSVIDVRDVAHLISEEVYARSTLEQLRKSFTMSCSQYDSDFNNLYNKDNMLAVPKDALTYYAGADACTTFNVALGVSSALKKEPEYKRQLFYYREMVMPCINHVFLPMEDVGILVAASSLAGIRQELQAEMDTLYANIISAIPETIKGKYRDKRSIDPPLTKTNMVREMLYSPLGFKLSVPKLKGGVSKGDRSIDKKTRFVLSSGKLKEEVASFISNYDRWQMINTLLTRYVTGIEKSIRLDGRIHPSFSLSVAATGRANCLQPNLQNIPKRGPLANIIRKLFIPKPGYKFIAIDASQSEIRWCAYLSQDPVMLDIYRNNGDIHASTAEAVMGKSRDEMTSEDFKKARQSGKSIVFGNLFGAGWRTFQQVARLDYGVEFTDKEAKEFREKFFKTYPGLGVYHRRVIRDCHTKGYVISPLGRVRHLPEIYSLDDALVRRAERQALNQPIQSVSSDSVLLAAYEIGKELNNSECQLCLFIHDELIFECREDKVSHYIPIIRYHMEHPPVKKFGVDLNLPLGSEIKVGGSLGELVVIND